MSDLRAGVPPGLYFAVHHPQRVSHLIMLDAAATARLDKVFPSLGIYRELVKHAPFVNRWHEEMNGFVAADLERLAPTGLLTSSSRSFIVTLATLHIYAQSQRDWRRYAAMVDQPALLIQARESFLMGMPLLTKDKALQTVKPAAGALCTRKEQPFHDAVRSRCQRHYRHHHGVSSRQRLKAGPA